MKSKKTYAVFGLGRYGLAVAMELVASGREVIAVDRNQKLSMMWQPFCPYASAQMLQTQRLFLA